MQAAEILRKVFYHNDIFRTGGDEFIVIASGIGRAPFEHKMKRLTIDSQKHTGVCFALGAAWSDGSVDIPTALKDADRQMYADKAAYYAHNPAERRL